MITKETTNVELYTVYLVTNAVDGKKYVGKTAYPLPVRWGQHVHRAIRGDRRTALSAAIKEFGWRSFSVSEIACLGSNEAACEYETALIRLFGTLVPAGYNKTAGGDGLHGCCKETRDLLREKMKERKPPTIATRAKIGFASAHRSKETLEALRVAGATNYKKSIGKRVYAPYTQEQKNRMAATRARNKEKKVQQ